MKKNESVLFPPQRQPIGAIFILGYNAFRGLIGQFWPFLLIILLNRSRSGRNLWLMIGAIGLGVMSFVMSLIGYFRFTFAVMNGEIVIDQGVFTRVRTTVSFSKVQSVNFEQKILHRILGLVSFRIDTAGSEQSEITIPAMNFDTARELRDIILEQKRRIKKSDTGETESEEDMASSAGDVIFRLSLTDLMKVGVSVNHLRTMGIILALAWGIYVEVSDVFDDIINNILNQEFLPRNASLLMYTLIAVPALFIVAFGTSLVLTALRFYNLTVYRIDGGLKVVAGLLNRNEQTAKRMKTQVMTWITNPIRRLFKMYNVRLKQASSAEVNRQQAITIAGCYEDQVDQLRDYYFGKYLDDPFQSYGIRREIILRYTLYFGLLPALAIGLLIYFTSDAIPWFVIFWIPVAYFLFTIYHSKWSININRNLIFIERGIFGLRTDMIMLYKIQSVYIRQTPYLHRKHLANLYIQTAAGSILIPYIYKDFAEQIMDMILYKIESSEKAWM